ncbi:MAG: ester cyclase [Xanthomonadales bacterium]|nr:ester cyclase [Xanthomonadales bacterium]
MSSGAESKEVIRRMVAALNEHVIEGQEKYWKKGSSWNGPAGAGVKETLKHFQEGWQRPFLKAFPDKKANDEVVVAEGEWVAAMGHVSATHEGEFMGAEGSGKEISLKYMDFWRIEDGKIAENYVLLDLIDFFRQIGIDLLDGKGWDDRGREVLEQD